MTHYLSSPIPLLVYHLRSPLIMCLDVTTVSGCCTNVYIRHLNCCTYSGTEIVKAVVIPVVMHGCESWTIKKAECQRISAFQLWCWRKLLRVPWTARRSKLSVLKKINPEYLLEGLMLKLKLRYFGYLMQRADSLEKTLMLGKIEGRRRKGQQRTG